MNNLLFLLIGLAVAGTLTYRLFLGVDFGDESFHLASAYNFLLGAKAFKDQAGVGQMFAFFTLPFVKVFHFFSPTNEYLVLKMRFLYLFARIAFCFLTFPVLRSFLPVPQALIFLATITSLFYVPVNVFSLHYGSLGSLFLGSSLCLSFLAAKNNRGWQTLASGFLLGCATICHPGIFPTVIFLFFFVRNRTPLSGIGFLSAWLLVMWFFDFSPLDYFRAALATKSSITQNGTDLGISKLIGTISGFFPKGPLLVPTALWFVILIGVLRKKRRSFAFALLLIFPLLVFFNSRASHGGIGVSGYVLNLIYLSPILCGYVYGWQKTKAYLKTFLLPSFLSFAGCSFLSTGGVAGASGVFLFLLPFSLILLSEALRKTSEGRFDKERELINAIPLILFLIFFIRGTFTSVYQENTRDRALTGHVSSGVFGGLKTTETKKNFIESLQHDLGILGLQRGRVTVSCFFPAGYLLTSLLPNHNSLWSAPLIEAIKPDTDLIIHIFDKTYPQIDVWPQRCESLSETFAGRQGTLIKRPGYEIWIRNG